MAALADEQVTARDPQPLPWLSTRINQGFLLRQGNVDLLQQNRAGDDES